MPKRWPVILWAIFLLVVHLPLAAHSEYWLGVVTTHPVGDDFNIYYRAHQKAVAGQNPYEPYGIGSGFVYHPAALTLIGLFAATGSQALAAWLWIGASAFAWGASLWLGLRLAQAAWARQPGAQAEPGRTWLAVCLLLGFAPFWETLHIGQINAFVVLALLLALHFAGQGRPLAAGLALALAIVLKTSPVILLAYFVAARKYRVALWALLCLAALSFVAGAQFSPLTLAQYWEILPRLGGELHPDSYNQSILSVAYRTSPGAAEPGVWVLAFRAAGVVVSAGLLIAGWRHHRRAAAPSIWLYMALNAALVIFSPLVWYHHSALLLLPLMVLLVSPTTPGFRLGLAVMMIIQAERLFEHLVTLTAYPIVGAHLCLLAGLIVMYRKQAGPGARRLVQAPSA